MFEWGISISGRQGVQTSRGVLEIEFWGEEGVFAQNPWRRRPPRPVRPPSPARHIHTACCVAFHPMSGVFSNGGSVGGPARKPPVAVGDSASLGRGGDSGRYGGPPVPSEPPRKPVSSYGSAGDGGGPRGGLWGGPAAAPAPALRPLSAGSSTYGFDAGSHAEYTPVSSRASTDSPGLRGEGALAPQLVAL